MARIIEFHIKLVIILIAVHCSLSMMPSKNFDWDSNSFMDLKNIQIPDVSFDQILSSKSKSNQQIQGVPDTKPLSSPRKDSLFDLDGFNNSPPPSQPLEQQRPKSLPNLPSIDSKFHDQGSRLENKPVPSKKLGWDYEPDFDVFHKGPQGVVRSWHTKDGKGDDHIWHTKETHHHHHHHHHHASEEDHEHEHGHKHDNWHKHDHVSFNHLSLLIQSSSF
ncbi:lateral signaling target protein 2 homolog [Tetranychus urticae]|uniref:lateral signaling target protein 2 homolog n=1 Tax=Tetranychus urticae TaxID=32264 RepID=UPI00077BB0D0|nr:lateral signaling target protein 2 homolog [Tetranychus urticae]